MSKRRIERLERKVKNQDEEELIAAGNWATWELSNVEVFGGYPGPVYHFGDYIFIVDPGNESTKYASLYAFEPKELILAWKNQDIDQLRESSKI